MVRFPTLLGVHGAGVFYNTLTVPLAPVTEKNTDRAGGDGLLPLRQSLQDRLQAAPDEDPLSDHRGGDWRVSTLSMTEPVDE